MALGSQSYQAGNTGYSGSEQARPAFAVLAVVAATAATIALASRAGAGPAERPSEGSPSDADHGGTSSAAVWPRPRWLRSSWLRSSWRRSSWRRSSRRRSAPRRADRPGAGRHRVPAAPGHAPRGAGRRPRARPFRGPARAALLYHRASRGQAGPARPDAPAGAEFGG